MKRAVGLFSLLCLPLTTPLMAQEGLLPSTPVLQEAAAPLPAPLPPLPTSPEAGDAGGSLLQQMLQKRMEERREEVRHRREAMQQMSPEDRHQLRRDIRDAGHALYPRGQRRHEKD